MFSNSDDELWAPAVWIWHPGQEKTYNFHLLARKVFSLDAEITQATCIISTNNAYELHINGQWMDRGQSVPIRNGNTMTNTT